MGWRFYQNVRDADITKSEKHLNYAIIAGLSLLHIAEGMKSVYFGIEYQSQGAFETWFSTVGRLGIKLVLDLCTELGHIFIVCATIQRMISLVSLPRQLTDEPPRDVHSLLGYSIGVVRIAMPFLALVMHAKVNCFSIYEICVYLVESFIFLYVTVVTFVHLKRVQNEEMLSIPAWQLFSNPLVTGALCATSFLSFIIMAATFDFAYETTLITPANIGPVIVPTFFTLLAGLFLIIYQDTKAMLMEARTPASGGKGRRVKFSIRDL
ncbi:hypothetical protein HDV03_003323 [Kappamyces sp. JEL0829]|nr:hypothetical protein HDV03_003323 [Kappamyces sp. JEL0829]